tara:strand:+ start:119 stop:637 length:519 start_codon:yes stop_codon:yes gene_type:complete
MANGNPYGPLYNSIAARGKMYPVTQPGAIKPYKKEKSFGDKMAQALGGMIDQAGESDKAGKKEQLAQLELEFKEINKVLKTGTFRSYPGADPMQQAEKWFWNKNYSGDKSSPPDLSLIDRFFALKGQIGQLKGQEQYRNREPSAFDYQFEDTVRPKDNGLLDIFSYYNKLKD